MFDDTCAELLAQIDTLTDAAKLSETVRDEAARLAVVGGNLSVFETSLINGPSSLALWRVYDHCASITRLYSVMDVFISSLAVDVCDAYPRYGEPYSKLPEKVRKAHRTGFGKIVLEIEEKRYHQALDQSDLVVTYQKCLSDEIPYKLIPQAFLTAKRALRLPELLAILNTIGFVEVEQKLVGHEFLRPYLADVLPTSRKSSLQKKLDEFIDARNDAAHAVVSLTWGTEQLRKEAYFVRDLCLAIANIGELQFAGRSIEAGLFQRVGVVSEVYLGGFVAVVIAEPCTVTRGIELFIKHDTEVRIGLLVSIEVNDVSEESATAVAGAELGLNITTKSHIGDEIYARFDLPSSQQLPPDPATDEDMESDLLESAHDEDEDIPEEALIAGDEDTGITPATPAPSPIPR